MKILILVILASLSFLPGQRVSEDDIRKLGADCFFSASEIPDDIFGRMQGKSYKKDCTVPRDSLSYILCLHRNASGQALVGEMVVNKRISERMLVILKELYTENYPIERMRLVDLYDADDERSMTDNNSSSFNFRFISHTDIVSKHGLGIAVDINPLYNPYHKTLNDGREVIEPSCAAPYLDREASFPYKITDDDLCCRLFKKYGFEWGGDWKTKKDYQHFELKE